MAHVSLNRFIPYTPGDGSSQKVAETCDDGKQNQDEMWIDCGGKCRECTG